jgi:hypothetical protein
VDRAGGAVSGLPIRAIGGLWEHPRVVARTTTGPDGRFRLDGLFPGVRYAFVRKDGYRFTGARVDGDTDDLAIALLKTTEPPPTWKPAAGPTFDDQRAFARGVLVRVWEKFGADAEQNGASG